MKLSNRILSMDQSPIRRLIPYAERAESKGKKVIYLNIGQPDIKTPKEFIDAINSYEISVLEYAPSRGLKETINTIQSHLKGYSLEYELDEILVTNGASEAIIFALLAICDKDDEVLTIEPFYSNYSSFVKLADARLKGIMTRVENKFILPPLEEMEKYVTGKTRAIILSNPANPTGRVYTKDEIESIIDLAKKHDLFILADEVYREFNFTKRPFISFGDYKEVNDRVVLLDSISKKYSACGARIGALASKNKEFIENVLKLCQARLAVSTLDQFGASAMSQVDKSYLVDNAKIYRHRRDILDSVLNDIPGLKYATPEGAFYTIVDLPVENAQDFIIWTLENIEIDNTTILLTPADSFYTNPKDGINKCRLSYCVNEEKISLAGKILAKALKEYPGTIK